MKSIHQHGTTYISIPRTVPDANCGAVIDKSKSERATENEAIRGNITLPNGHIVADKRPSLDHFLCNYCGHYVYKTGFSPDKRNRDGIRHICKDCDMRRQQNYRNEQVKHFRRVKAYPLTET